MLYYLRLRGREEGGTNIAANIVAVFATLKDVLMDKDYKLAQAANQSVVYNSLLGVIKNPKFWKRSIVGREYCRFTDEGREVAVDLLQDLMRTMDILDQKAQDQHAKELVVKTLKDE